MKKLAFLIAFAAVTFVANAAKWGFMPRESSLSSNVSNKQAHINFMSFGQPFSIPASTLYKLPNGQPMDWKEYSSRASSMASVNLKSLVGLYNGFPKEYRDQLLADNGLNPNTIIDAETALKIFAGETVKYAQIPLWLKVIYDGYDTDNKSIIVIPERSPKKLVDGPEGGFWQYVTGYEPLLIRSAYCGNNVESGWANAHIRRNTTVSNQPLPDDNSAGDYNQAAAQGPPGPQGPKGDKGDRGEAAAADANAIAAQRLQDYKDGLKDAALLAKSNCSTCPATAIPVQQNGIYIPTNSFSPGYINQGYAMNTGYSNPGYCAPSRGVQISQEARGWSGEVRHWVGMFLGRGNNNCNTGYQQPHVQQQQHYNNNQPTNWNYSTQTTKPPTDWGYGTSPVQTNPPTDYGFGLRRRR